MFASILFDFALTKQRLVKQNWYKYCSLVNRLFFIDKPVFCHVRLVWKLPEHGFKSDFWVRLGYEDLKTGWIRLGLKDSNLGLTQECAEPNFGSGWALVVKIWVNLGQVDPHSSKFRSILIVLVRFILPHYNKWMGFFSGTIWKT